MIIELILFSLFGGAVLVIHDEYIEESEYQQYKSRRERYDEDKL